MSKIIRNICFPSNQTTWIRKAEITKDVNSETTSSFRIIIRSLGTNVVALHYLDAKKSAEFSNCMQNCLHNSY